MGNSEFEVSYPRLDQEHVGLFEIMYQVERNLQSQEKVDKLQELMRDHFYYEEAEFCDSLDLPWDYCKEHKAMHVKFSESFATDYSRIDEEHDVLFANILAVSQHPDDAAKLQDLKDNMDLHFQYEEQRFCAIPTLP